MGIILMQAIHYFAEVLKFLILVRIIVSWINLDRNGPVMQILYMLTEPILGPIRRMLNKSPLGGPGMMLDFSPIIAYFLIQIGRSVLIGAVVGLL